MARLTFGKEAHHFRNPLPARIAPNFDIGFKITQNKGDMLRGGVVEN
jgi:hypothetical protein